MPKALNDLLSKRANVWEQMQGVFEPAEKEGRDFTGEEEQKYQNLEGEIRKLNDEIEESRKYTDLKKLMETSTDFRSGDGSDMDLPGETFKGGNEKEDLTYRKAFIEYVRGGMASLTQEEKMAFRAGFRQHNGEARAQAVGSGGAGGYLVPQGFRAELIRTMKAFGNVRSVAQNIETPTGNVLPWPTVDDTANTGRLLAENVQITETDVTFGTAQLGAYMFSSDSVLVSLQFLQDIPWEDVEATLASLLGERVARIQNQYFTTGTGSSQPEGIITNATAGVTLGTGMTTSVNYDGLIDLVHSVDPAYRQSGRCQFMTNDLTLAAFRKLKDSQNRPLWEPSVQSGEPDRILGYPINVNNQMSTMQANAKSILFGDFQAGFVVRDALDFQVIRLDERYADYLQVGFIGFARADSRRQNGGAYKALVQSAT